MSKDINELKAITMEILLGYTSDIPKDISASELWGLATNVVQFQEKKNDEVFLIALQLNALWMSLKGFEQQNTKDVALALGYYLGNKIKEIILAEKPSEKVASDPKWKALLSIYTKNDIFSKNPLIEVLVNYGIPKEMILNFTSSLENVVKKSANNVVYKKLEIAAKNFLSKHKKLLENDTNERSITHKFAECLAPLFDEWDVDCEYNRQGHDPEKSKRLIPKAETIYTNDIKGKTIFPDIIIHHRGENGLINNLLVIEAKKMNSSESEREKDLEKLEAIKKDLKYQMSAFIEIGVGPEAEIKITNFKE